MALAVDELDEQFSLRVRQFLHAWRIGALDIFLNQFQVFVAGFLVGQRLQVFVGLDDDIMTFLRNGQHLLHVVNQAVILLALLLVLESGLRIHIHVVHLHVLNAIAVDKRLTHFHHWHIGGRIHHDLTVFRIDVLTLLCPRGKATHT